MRAVIANKAKITRHSHFRWCFLATSKTTAVEEPSAAKKDMVSFNSIDEGGFFESSSDDEGGS
jgi:hypothetical protein